MNSRTYNLQQSKQEVEDFKQGKALTYFAYFRDGTQPTITTFTGDKLADVTLLGHEYKVPAFGRVPSTRVNFRAKGIDGRMWAGTYYKSSGDYVRMRVIKGKG
jgi:hypothetical protein